MSETLLQPVDMHEAFKRDPSRRDSANIAYVRLSDAAQEVKSGEMARLKAFWASPEGSIEEEKLARDAAVGYFVLTGAQLQTAKISEQPIVSERFTQASVELYGKPDEQEVKNLIAVELEEFEELIGSSEVDQERLKRLLDFLRSQLGGAEVVNDRNSELDNALSEMKEVLMKRFEKPLAVFQFSQEESKQKVPAQQVAKLFQRAIDIMAEDDPSWSGWESKVTEDAAMDTNRRKKTFGVGRDPRQAGLIIFSFVHEVLGHGLRGVNGSKTGDEKLEYGLPGSHTTDEGVAVLLAAALRGHLSDRSKDFYMDTAFALGQLGQPAIPRAKLQQIDLDKLIIRSQSKGQPVDEEALSKKSWGHINRVYRGSLGNEVIGVNTIDASYYDGFIIIGNYICKEMAAGKSAEEIFDYITSANFDPTNQSHAKYRERILESSYSVG